MSQVLGCLVSDEAAHERCAALVTDGASHGWWDFVSPQMEHLTINGVSHVTKHLTRDGVPCER